MDESELGYFEYLKKTVSYILNIKILAGLVLLGIGGYGAFFILGLIKTALTEPENLAIVTHIASLAPEGIVFSVTGGSLTIPSAFFSFALLILLLGTAQGIASKFAALGIQLISIEIKTLLDRLREEWKSIRMEQKAQRQQEAERMNQFKR